MNLNKIFRDKDNNVYTRLNADEVANFQGNSISIYGCVLNGKQVAMPEVLYNEIGVEYHYVNYAEHGKKMAKKHGVFMAVKQENIRVWHNVKPGEKLQSVIDGFVEHEVELKEGFVAAQNVIKGEFYGISKDVLAEKYEFVESQFDYDLYKPKASAVQQWTYSDVNTYGELWGGLEFLTTPMINITKEDDTYGCNYQVFWGWDGKLASYRVLGYFRGCGQVFYPDYEGEPRKVAQATFQPPRVLFM